MACEHPDFIANVAVNRFPETGRFSADVKVECSACHEPFRFLGVPGGLSWEVPRVSIDGCELRAPIEPEGEKRLLTNSTFEMPPELNRDVN